MNEDGVGNNLQLIYADQMQKCEELGKKDKIWFLKNFYLTFSSENFEAATVWDIRTAFKFLLLAFTG